MSLNCEKRKLFIYLYILFDDFIIIVPSNKRKDDGKMAASYRRDEVH